MGPEEFRRHGHAAVDWVADYLQRVGEYPVLAPVAPGEVRAKLPPHPPEHGEDFTAVLADMDRVVVPGLTHWQSPSFFAYFPANVSAPSIIGELLSAGLAVQGMLWSTSPACTEVETHMLDWVVELLGLPARFRSDGPGGGVIQDSASSATLCALLAARHRVTGGVADRRGLAAAGTGGPLVVYTSPEAHSSVEKAVRITGLGSDALRLVDTDDAYALRPDALAAAITEDRGAGRTPCMVVATVGTTGSNAVDPVRAIGEVCAGTGVWLHVDAAMSGTAAVCPELRWIHDGVELADSYCFNPHKWMLVNFDCDCLYVADRSALVGALSVLPEYLRNAASESGAVIDFRDWQVPLGRRFRALKLWFVIRHYGAEGLRHHVRSHVALARQLAGWVEADQDWELAAPVPLNLVCLRHRAGDEVSQAAMEAVNASGRAYLTHTRLGGRYTVRVAIGGAQTRREHVEGVWELLRAAARDPG
ncbi:MAG: aspartate aminotransferase family protein [Euzebyales bacterium]|nr:aspartate aminotransferase family protein [Euzebyales bacterium]